MIILVALRKDSRFNIIIKINIPYIISILHSIFTLYTHCSHATYTLYKLKSYTILLYYFTLYYTHYLLHADLKEPKPFYQYYNICYIDLFY